MADQDASSFGQTAAGWMQAVSPLFKTVGTPQPSGPSRAESSIVNDSAGYAVNLGSGTVNSTTGLKFTQWEIAGLVALGLMVLLTLSKKK